MDIRILRYFLAIAQEKSISKAAQYLHISQPALSRQITDLENELNIKLFDRGPREIKLTKDGHYLRQKASEIVQLVDKTSYNLQANSNIVNGELDIGAGESMGMQRIMEVIAGIITDYPDIKLHFHSGDSTDVESKLESEILDFGVIMGEKPLSQYETLKLPEVDHWGILMPFDSTLVKKDTISPEDLVKIPLLVSNQAKQRVRFQDWWSNVSNDLNIIGTYNLAFNASLLVKTKKCVALTFDDLINTDKNSGLVFKRLNPDLSEPITLIWKKNKLMSSAASLFIKRLKENIAKKA
ncbi:LysR family transcriptional regulator [Companilactobacillus sp. DQM5]|uniref:LysR family transcriptional regulator n=1 Tax=Companilactobacillus sp. DQM5 TaxID=3463359 RepID=UPI004057EC0D